MEFFYTDFFIMDFFIQHFLEIFFILTTDKNSAEIEIAIIICWFRYWAAYVR